MALLKTKPNLYSNKSGELKKMFFISCITLKVLLCGNSLGDQKWLGMEVIYVIDSSI